MGLIRLLSYEDITDIELLHINITNNCLNVIQLLKDNNLHYKLEGVYIFERDILIIITQLEQFMSDLKSTIDVTIELFKHIKKVSYTAEQIVEFEEKLNQLMDSIENLGLKLDEFKSKSTNLLISLNNLKKLSSNNINFLRFDVLQIIIQTNKLIKESKQYIYDTILYQTRLATKMERFI